jgi:hypothetical protein
MLAAKALSVVQGEKKYYNKPFIRTYIFTYCVILAFETV